MKQGVFITVRSDSSRLPGKAFREILGLPVLAHVIRRAKLVQNAEIVVCTTTRNQDDCICELAEKEKVLFFRVSLEDKLDRWKGAAEAFGLDRFATFDADDLLCSPRLIEQGLIQLEEENLDFLKAPENLGIGAFTYAISVPALKKVCSIKGSHDTEMMWTYFEDTGLFRVGILNVKDPVLLHPFRLTLDYPEDFEFFRKIFEHFQNRKNDIPLEEVMRYLIPNHSVVAVNQFRHEEWRKNQIEKTKLVLK